eukprot:scaffold2312_cov165-Ochromonas_danica.AAC.79
MGASKDKPHSHNGILEPYDGKPLPLHLTADQKNKLERGESVMYNERTGKSGRGVVIQDINATQSICMSKIRDLSMYTKMVPHVKKVEIYEDYKLANVSYPSSILSDQMSPRCCSLHLVGHVT